VRRSRGVPAGWAASPPFALARETGAAKLSMNQAREEEGLIILGVLFLVAGTACMAFAGVRYWRSDPMLFLLTPVWHGESRLFAGRGWQLYLAGAAFTLAGIIALLAARLLPLH